MRELQIEREPDCCVHRTVKHEQASFYNIFDCHAQARVYPMIDISLPPKQEWELRVIIWRADGACSGFAFNVGADHILCRSANGTIRVS